MKAFLKSIDGVFVLQPKVTTVGRDGCNLAIQVCYPITTCFVVSFNTPTFIPYNNQFPTLACHCLSYPKSQKGLGIKYLCDLMCKPLSTVFSRPFLPHISLPVSIPCTVHHSDLTVCLPQSLDLDHLLIDFWMKCLINIK